MILYYLADLESYSEVHAMFILNVVDSANSAESIVTKYMLVYYTLYNSMVGLCNIIPPESSFSFIMWLSILQIIINCHLEDYNNYDMGVNYQKCRDGWSYSIWNIWGGGG